MLTDERKSELKDLFGIPYAVQDADFLIFEKIEQRIRDAQQEMYRRLDEINKDLLGRIHRVNQGPFGS